MPLSSVVVITAATAIFAIFGLASLGAQQERRFNSLQARRMPARRRAF